MKADWFGFRAPAEFLVGTDIAVKSGLASGDRIAVAGVTILTEGQMVTLYGE